MKVYGLFKKLELELMIKMIFCTILHGMVYWNKK